MLNTHWPRTEVRFLSPFIHHFILLTCIKMPFPSLILKVILSYALSFAGPCLIWIKPVDPKNKHRSSQYQGILIGLWINCWNLAIENKFWISLQNSFTNAACWILLFSIPSVLIWFWVLLLQCMDAHPPIRLGSIWDQFIKNLRIFLKFNLIHILKFYPLELIICCTSECTLEVTFLSTF